MSDRDNPVNLNDAPLAIRRGRSDLKPVHAPDLGPPRPIVVVLGMHRSGTSLLSNVLHSLGVDMADTSDHVSPKNAGGFWERPHLVAIQDEILAAIGRPIAKPSHVLPFPPAWWRSKEVQAIKPKLLAYVREQLSSPMPWGFKDPRTCRLLPLWWEVFRELNLEPIYIHALRTPAEAAHSMSRKSSARRLSLATSELMWLSYNYDIARHVTLKRQPLVVDYDEWFEDAPAVTMRLADRLNIGGELSADELVEYARSTVRSEYRHHVAGKEGLECDVPLAEMLYRALTEAPLNDVTEQPQLRTQLRLVEMFFKSVRPIMEDFDCAIEAQARLGEDSAQLAERLANAEQSLQEERENFADQLASGNRRVEALERERERLDAELENRRAKVAALQDERRTILEDLRGKNELLKAGEAERAQLAQQETETRESLEAELAKRNHRIESLERERDRLQADLENRRAKVAALQDERRTMLEELEAKSELLKRLEAERAQLAESEAEARQSLEAELGRLRTLESERDELKKEKDETESLIHALQQERDRIAEELQDAERRAEAGGGGEGGAGRVFIFPSEGVTAFDVEGEIDQVDERGIRGSVLFPARPALAPVVEARVGGDLVLALVCAREVTESKDAADKRWSFTIPWSRFAEQHAGKQTVVRIAGLDHEIGRARIPADLRDYHLSPAALAAKRLGGTIDEAAQYHRWIAEHEDGGDRESARAFYSDLQSGWPIIALFVYGDDKAAMAATVKSLQAQVYREWEAICVDAPPELQADDGRVRVVPAHEVESCIHAYGGETLFSFVEAGDLLSPSALLHLGNAARENPDFALIYSDEDRVDPRSGVRALPFMKGAWSPDLAFETDYVSRAALVRRSNLGDLSRLDRSAVYATTLSAALSQDGAVKHLPFVLYHRASPVGPMPELAGAVRSVLRARLAADVNLADADAGQWKLTWPLPEPPPKVSLIVPTRDRADLLRVCVEGFLHETDYSNLEVIIADNDSAEEETKAYLAKLATHPRVKVVHCPGPFNYSRINNLAAEQASGSVLGLMNNDLKVLDPHWLPQMVAHAIRPDIGIVGAKLLHGDDTVQHVGIALGIGVASHLYKGFPADAEGHGGRLVRTQDVSAVTAACLLTRREVWNELGGLDEDFPVAYNDVDLCLKVTAAGYRVLWTPEAVVYHLESQSRGKDTAPEKRGRLEQDKSRLIARWGGRLANDPFHSPNLSDKHTDGRLAFPPRVVPPWRRAAPWRC